MNLLPPIIPVNPDSSNTIAKVVAIAARELGGHFEFCRLETCGVPVCECDFLSLHFRSLENSRLNFSLKIQVMSLKFEAKSNNPSLAEHIGKELTPDDTLEFIGLMAYGKSEQFKQMDVKNLGIDKQGEKALLANLSGLIPFNYTFPWAPGMVYENDKGRTVTVIDRYCTNPACPCTESLIEVTSCDGHPFEAKNKAVEAEFFYDYRAGHIPSHDKGEDSTENNETLAELRSTDPELDSFLEQRHEQIHQLAGHLASVNKPKSTTPKAGRNAPCPCGSGKKYKKCCG